MSGHSKWSQIKRSKGAKDAKRGVLFSKLSKKITIAAKNGTPDPALNFQLRTEVDNARAEGMPNDNIERAIKKASDKNSASLTEALYEGYGPFGTAFMVEVATDNTNRAVQTIKHTLSKHGGSLGAMGSVAWQFSDRGQILIERTENRGQKIELSTLELVAIDAGAEDVVETEEGLEVQTNPSTLEQVKNALEQAGAIVAQAHTAKLATQPVTLTPEQQAEVEAIYEELEDNEDVVTIYTSAQL